MGEEQNYLILVQNLVKIELFKQGVYAEMKEKVEIKKVSVIIGENWLNFDDKYELICVNLCYHLYYCSKIPQVLLGDIVNYKKTIIDIPEAFGEFWSIIKMNFID